MFSLFAVTNAISYPAKKAMIIRVTKMPITITSSVIPKSYHKYTNPKGYL
jgi:hypothetical protein